MNDLSQIRKEIAIARLRVMPSSRRIAIGNFGTFTKDQLISEVQKDTKIGKLVVNVQMQFLTSLKKGTLYSTPAPV